LNPAQLRGAAAALAPREELPAGGEEPRRPGSPDQEHEEVEVSSHEQRSEALRALLLARKRTPRSGGDTNGTLGDGDANPS